MTVRTNHSVITFWEICNEAVSVGLLGCINDLSVSGFRLPKADIFNDR